MDADWGEIAHVHFTLGRTYLQPPASLTTVAFDTAQELLWVGGDYGRVSSIWHILGDKSDDLRRYTAFKAHPAHHGAVRQFLFNERGVICLGPQSVHMALRTGPPIWHISHEDMTDLRCMSFTSKGTSEIIVAGHQDTMFVIDVKKGEITKQLPTTEQYTIMKKSRYICATTTTGNVDILDPISLKVIKTWTTQSALINSMDSQQDFIVTCGASLKQSSYMMDPYLSVFDLKNMSSMSPIPFPPLAAYVRMHPRMVTTAIVMSHGGQMHVVDIMNPNTTNVKQAMAAGYVTMLDISQSGGVLLFADTDGFLHLWGLTSKGNYTDVGTQPELPQEEQEPVATVDWNGDIPFGVVGMPYYREALLSSWPAHLISDVGAPPVKFDTNYLATLHSSEFGMYGKSAPGLLRNQVQNTRTAAQAAEALQAPKFLSEKAKESAKALASSLGIPPEGSLHSPVATEIESLKPEVPTMYRSVEIKFSKFGVDDFDFGFFNKTPYAGLENYISNSYANSLLQLMHFTPIIRNLSLQHAATSCLSEQCLLCELGFLNDQLEKAEGAPCQAANMLKMLGSHPGVGNLYLLEDDPHASSLPAMVQGLTRFLLDQMCRDYMRTLPAENVMEQVIATSAVISMKCINCSSETTRPSSTFVNDLLYPQLNNTFVRGGRLPSTYSFSEIVRRSIERETNSKGWCSTCQRYQPLASRRAIKGIPEVLAVNANISTLEQRRLWATPGWLPEEIGIIIGEEHLYCFEGEDLKLHLQRAKHEIYVYSLIGAVVNIDRGAPHKPHLVAMVNVAHSAPTPPGQSQWHLFNDFLVKPVSPEEALTFNTTWKTPSVVFFQLKAANNQIDSTWKQNLDLSILYQDQSANHEAKTYRVLDPATERPGLNTVIAFDTEFVLVKEPEIEVKADGDKETIRPNVYSLARVSVVRGEGHERGEPFIDDYISIKEPIVDYLTIYSGIHPGDLDPRESKHNLVSLKIAFKKLWVLLNLGCRFLGHGVRQDFRVINIQVPKSQVIDTIDLFFSRTRLRKLSLAFLAWYLLKEDIQLETHDSIEDARTALELYRKYEEFEEAGVLEVMIEDIYRVGRELNFRPPRRDDQVVQRTETPPVFAGTVGEVPSGGVNRPSTPSRKSGGGGLLAQGSGQLMGSSPTWLPPAFTPKKGTPLQK